MKDLVFTNSYGQKATFPGTPAALLSLKNRKFKYVGPEVLEALERIFDRTVNGKGAKTNTTNIALELNIKPSIARQVLSRLKQTGLTEELYSEDYIILRKPTEKDCEAFKE